MLLKESRNSSIGWLSPTFRQYLLDLRKVISIFRWDVNERMHLISSRTTCLAHRGPPVVPYWSVFGWLSPTFRQCLLDLRKVISIFRWDVNERMYLISSHTTCLTHRGPPVVPYWSVVGWFSPTFRQCLLDLRKVISIFRWGVNERMYLISSRTTCLAHRGPPVVPYCTAKTWSEKQ